MSTPTSFKLFNSSNSDMEIIHERECFTFNLPVNEEVVVESDSCKEYSIKNIFR
jgi:hypothetical protein